MMSTTPRKTGRPQRASPPVIVRGVVPDSHPLAERLRGLSPARATVILLEMATGRMAVNGPSTHQEITTLTAPPNRPGARDGARHDAVLADHGDDLSSLFSMSE